MIDMDPTNMRCHTSSHLWPALSWKATEVIDNEPPDCVPRSIILRLGDFTQKWAFLSARDDWRQDRAFNNCWKWSLLRILSHMLTGKAIARAIRGHFFADAILNAELYRARVATKCKTYRSVQTDYASVWCKNSGMLIISRILRLVLRQIMI